MVLSLSLVWILLLLDRLHCLPCIQHATSSTTLLGLRFESFIHCPLFLLNFVSGAVRLADE
ncbi:hypothetical protein GLYMA_18G182150v4 [Glycine max]|nr:hypothetical protein GLYMA_18G182150v4 [Glycine max]KAH1155030.1 hypothetical protein GYH30_050362 [Glycine max]